MFGLARTTGSLCPRLRTVRNISTIADAATVYFFIALQVRVTPLGVSSTRNSHSFACKETPEGVTLTPSKSHSRFSDPANEIGESRVWSNIIPSRVDAQKQVELATRKAGPPLTQAVPTRSPSPVRCLTPAFEQRTAVVETIKQGVVVVISPAFRAAFHSLTFLISTTSDVSLPCEMTSLLSRDQSKANIRLDLRFVSLFGWPPSIG